MAGDRSDRALWVIFLAHGMLPVLAGLVVGIHYLLDLSWPEAISWVVVFDIGPILFHEVSRLRRLFPPEFPGSVAQDRPWYVRCLATLVFLLAMMPLFAVTTDMVSALAPLRTADGGPLPAVAYAGRALVWLPCFGLPVLGMAWLCYWLRSAGMSVKVVVFWGLLVCVRLIEPLAWRSRDGVCESDAFNLILLTCEAVAAVVAVLLVLYWQRSQALGGEDGGSP